MASSSSLHFCTPLQAGNPPPRPQTPSCPPKMLQAHEECPAQLCCLQAALGPPSRDSRYLSFLVHHAFNSNCSTSLPCITIFPEYDAVLKNGIKCLCEIAIDLFFPLNQQIKEFKHKSETPLFPPSGIHNEFSLINYSAIKLSNYFPLVFPNIKSTVHKISMWLLHKGKKK